MGVHKFTMIGGRGRGDWNGDGGKGREWEGVGGERVREGGGGGEEVQEREGRRG